MGFEMVEEYDLLEKNLLLDYDLWDIACRNSLLTTISQNNVVISELCFNCLRRALILPRNSAKHSWDTFVICTYYSFWKGRTACFCGLSPKGMLQRVPCHQQVLIIFKVPRFLAKRTALLLVPRSQRGKYSCMNIPRKHRGRILIFSVLCSS